VDCGFLSNSVLDGLIYYLPGRVLDLLYTSSISLSSCILLGSDISMLTYVAVLPLALPSLSFWLPLLACLVFTPPGINVLTTPASKVSNSL